MVIGGVNSLPSLFETRYGVVLGFGFNTGWGVVLGFGFNTGWGEAEPGIEPKTQYHTVPGLKKTHPVLNPKPSTTPYRVSKRLGN